MTLLRPISLGLIGAGRIGSSHAEIIARRVPGAVLVAVADPRPGVAEALATPLGARAETDPAAIFAADDIEGVVITASSDAHCQLVVAAASTGASPRTSWPPARSSSPGAWARRSCCGP